MKQFLFFYPPSSSLVIRKLWRFPRACIFSAFDFNDSMSDSLSSLDFAGPGDFSAMICFGKFFGAAFSEAVSGVFGAVRFHRSVAVHLYQFFSCFNNCVWFNPWTFLCTNWLISVFHGVVGSLNIVQIRNKYFISGGSDLMVTE